MPLSFRASFDGMSARERLASILDEGEIWARSAMGWAADQDDPNDPEAQTQRVVSFTETPLEHIYSHVADIENRRIRLEPYGIAMTKLRARKLGINPVWYVDMTPGRDWVIKEALNEMKEEVVAAGAFHHSNLAKILPFFEQMGTWPNIPSQKEFWWEREWRRVGDVDLPPNLKGCLVLCPEDELEEFERLARPGLLDPERRRRRRKCIDPRWGLEQVIAHLAGVPPEDVTPFGP
jgi:hypothetical protein